MSKTGKGAARRRHGVARRRKGVNVEEHPGKQ